MSGLSLLLMFVCVLTIVFRRIRRTRRTRAVVLHKVMPRSQGNATSNVSAGRRRIIAPDTIPTKKKNDSVSILDIIIISFAIRQCAIEQSSYFDI